MSNYNPRECLKDGSAIAAGIGVTAVALVIIFFVTDAINTPAWIQAIGSISAIILGFLIATFQSERNLIQARQLKEEERQSEIRKLKGVFNLSYVSYLEFFTRVDSGESIKDNINFLAGSYIRLVQTIQELKKIPYNEYPYPTAIFMKDCYITNLESIIQAFHIYAGMPPFDTFTLKDFDKLNESINEIKEADDKDCICAGEKGVKKVNILYELLMRSFEDPKFTIVECQHDIQRLFNSFDIM